MKTTTSKLNTKNYLEHFKQAREDRASKLAGLPYSEKIVIVEKLQADYGVIRKSISSLKPSKT